MGGKRNFFANRGRDTANDFKFKVTVASSENIPLPFEAGGTYDCYVNYGDGSGDKYINTYNHANADHTYTTGATYEISIWGQCTLFEVDNDANIDTNIIEVVQWGSIGLESLNFYGCTNLTTIPSTGFSGFSSITIFASLFRECPIGSIPSGMFDSATSATNFQQAFYNTNITSIPTDLFKFNTGVTTFLNTFLGSNITAIPVDLFRYNTIATNFIS